MAYKNIPIVELIIVSIVMGQAFAVIDAQEQMPSSENQQSLSSLGSLSSSSSASSAKVLSESAVPGKSSRYIIRFARAPTSMIRFSRSPSSQIRFGRSQPFVRFGRSNELNDEYGGRANNHYAAAAADKFIRYAKNGADEYYDENIQVEPRSGGDSGFIRFGRSQSLAPAPLKADTFRAINWRNFLRLGRNTNANIRFAGKRDGSSINRSSNSNVNSAARENGSSSSSSSSSSSTTAHHNAIPIEMLLEKIAQQKQSRATDTDIQDDRNTVTDDDQQAFDGIDAIGSDQYQTVYSNGNELEQN